MDAIIKNVVVPIMLLWGLYLISGAFRGSRRKIGQKPRR